MPTATRGEARDEVDEVTLLPCPAPGRSSVQTWKSKVKPYRFAITASFKLFYYWRAQFPALQTSTLIIALLHPQIKCFFWTVSILRLISIDLFGFIENVTILMVNYVTSIRCNVFEPNTSGSWKRSPVLYKEKIEGIYLKMY